MTTPTARNLETSRETPRVRPSQNSNFRNERTLQVTFAPDWRGGVPYQDLLAKALQNHGVDVAFLQGYKRLLPLSRLLKRQRLDLLHLHWPEAYYPRKGDAFDWFRCTRFPFDLNGAAKQAVLVTTAHNLYGHNRANEIFAERNVRCVHEVAKIVFAHSASAKQRLVGSLALPADKVWVIPHGDLSVALGSPIAASKARHELGLGAGKIALMFGVIEPYKGLEEVIDWWRRTRPDVQLAIVGRPHTTHYGAEVLSRVDHDKNIITDFDWLSDERLRLWLSAADVTLFNYRQIFTSGAASLARSFGVPILLPQRLVTVELGEPTPYVLRFEHFSINFAEQLASAIEIKPDFAAAASWREACNWDKVACLTAAAYRRAVG
jgi:beta-1,4-mannosyltransferase